METLEIFVTAAVATVEALRNIGYGSYLFGSTAFAVYGMDHRIPRNVDIAVLADDNVSVEDVKKQIVLYSDRFVLQSFVVEGQLCQVLYFGDDGGVGTCQLRKTCVVNILLAGSGSLYLPKIPNNCLVWYGYLPIAPLKTLVLLKLNAWYSHQADGREMMQTRLPQDVGDIMQSLRFVKSRYATCREPGNIHGWCSKALNELSITTISAFVRANPRSFADWWFLDFEVGVGVVRKAPYARVWVR
ncbi:hypothetical protein BDN72DRAFT_965244 [Pluteus cervinus]|uniref:Uncharacterized protein n=1 Tax=Pluteus cervinus TaxID=181527 RepID=A0ACD3A6V1_9AGAR|nr:hypothetical protein BDN72DRAFT_965244 [Pluteus cervinus]